MLVKLCSKCRKKKPVTRFSRNAYGKPGYRNPCKDCVNERLNTDEHRAKMAEYTRNWRRNNPVKNRAKYLKQYNVTIEQYEDQLKRQGNCCAICKGVNRDGRRLSVDHDHITGEFRGLLCALCNKGLGHFMDNPDFMVAATEYLDKYWLKAACGDCGYIIRVTQRWVDDSGLPTCPCGTEFELA